MSKKLSANEKLEIFHNFFFRLNFHRYVSCNEQKVHAMLAIADNYVNAHSVKQGVTSQKESEAAIKLALEKMRDLP